MDNNFEVILCIVNSGFADEVMAAAREVGARGGTIINARGTAREEAEKAFGISIHPEKEIVMIISAIDIKDSILDAINKRVGLQTPGQGIVFSLPVTDVVGFKKTKTTEEE